ncbi:MAG: helix-turn-helix domain-containing protein [Coriobacteriales bacterium]|nr:helix-turn-helix domain-containing protein [Coriobacteriales bacterium]
MNVEIAERLAKRRREAGLSQETLAERLGVTRQAVSKWERSESSPDTDNLIALARLYDVSLDELLYVDSAIEEDISYEAQDRARANDFVTTENSSSQGSEFSSQGSETGSQGSESRGQDSETSGFSEASSGGPSVYVNDDEDYVHINWRDGVHVKDSKTGEEVHVGWKGIDIKDPGGEHNWSGEWGDWENWTDGKGQRIVCSKKTNVWYKFPFPILVIIVYLLMGFFAPALKMPVGTVTAWGYGLFTFALIPIYYMTVDALIKHYIIRFFEGLYPFICFISFLWMWLMMGIPHPAWVIFLTIPIVEWALEAIHRHHKKTEPEVVVVSTDQSSVN